MTEGSPLGLYIGFVPTLAFRSFVSVYFGAYEGFKQVLAPLPVPVQARNFLSGGLGATVMYVHSAFLQRALSACRWLMAFPFDVVKNRIQAQRDDKPIYSSMRDCFRKLYAAEGWKGFYRGFTPCLLRSNFPLLFFVVIRLLHHAN
jgi:solute carrier family 25 carnitine/acylcarnitine transporter 20/29